MLKIIMSLIGFWCFAAFGVPCDCEVRVHSPLSGPFQMDPIILKSYQLESFSSYRKSSIGACRLSCLREFRRDMPIDRLNALLMTVSLQLIDQRTIGHNCTGLTTIKYPVRVRAKLGHIGLGNVEDMIHVVTHEEMCF